MCWMCPSDSALFDQVTIIAPTRKNRGRILQTKQQEQQEQEHQSLLQDFVQDCWCPVNAEQRAVTFLTEFFQRFLLCKDRIVEFALKCKNNPAIRPPNSIWLPQFKSWAIQMHSLRTKSWQKSALPLFAYHVFQRTYSNDVVDQLCDPMLRTALETTVSVLSSVPADGDVSSRQCQRMQPPVNNIVNRTIICDPCRSKIEQTTTLLFQPLLPQPLAGQICLLC
jgi:hypothetical protein